MTTQEFNSLQRGDEVLVSKSGKRYRVVHITAPMTDAEWQENEDRKAAGQTAWTNRRTERDVCFRQVRANSKGIVGLYGPGFVRLKAANIEPAPKEAL